MRLLKNWAIATFLLTFIVILAGGIVRTTQSGMGCPDWPTCFGKWIPPTSADQLPADFEKYLDKQDIDHSFNAWHTWIEYINRLVGVLLGLFAVVQLILAYRLRRSDKKVFRWSCIFFVLVVLTGLFGAVVVKLNLAHATITVHLLFAILLLLSELILLMYAFNRIHTVSVTPFIKHLQYFLLGCIVLQMVLGTGVRIYIDDISAVFQYTQREKWLASLPLFFIMHRSFSWLILVLSVFNFIKAASLPVMRSMTGFLLLIVLCNMATGIIMYVFNMPAIAQPLHLLLASIAVCQSVFIIFSIQTNKPELLLPVN